MMATYALVAWEGEYGPSQVSHRARPLVPDSRFITACGKRFGGSGSTHPDWDTWGVSGPFDASDEWPEITCPICRPMSSDQHRRVKADEPGCDDFCAADYEDWPCATERNSPANQQQADELARQAWWAGAARAPVGPVVDGFAAALAAARREERERHDRLRERVEALADRGFLASDDGGATLRVVTVSSLRAALAVLAAAPPDRGGL
jgi:hypothetical protein